MSVQHHVIRKLVAMGIAINLKNVLKEKLADGVKGGMGRRGRKATTLTNRAILMPQMMITQIYFAFLMRSDQYSAFARGDGSSVCGVPW